jgi:hypothetical protein
MNNIIKQKIFTSIDRKYKIKTELENNYLYFEIQQYDNSNILTFLSLIKDICHYIIKNKVEIIVQTINKNDYKLFKNSQIIFKNEDNYLIQTNKNDFLDEICNALGINQHIL